MFLVCVRPRAPDPPPPLSGGGTASARDDGPVRISVRTGAFGFVRDVDGRILAGETTGPLNEADCRRLDDGVRSATPFDSLLGDRILVLVLVDPAGRSATIAQSFGGWRPYYFVAEPWSLTLSTHLRGLRDAGCEVAWDPACTPEYLTYRYVVPPRSIARGIRKLAAGQCLALDLRTGTVREHRRWRLPPRGANASSAGISDALRSRVREWVTCFPNGGVPLSGGLDSSLLVALARADRPRIPTFSTSFFFANRDDGESRYALSMADHLGVPHEIHDVTAERYLSGWVESVATAEEPVHHLQSVLLHLLFRTRSAAGNDAMLSGEGAGGVFGGPRHRFLHRYRRTVALLRTTGIGIVLGPVADRLGCRGPMASLLTSGYDGDVRSWRHYLWLAGRYGDPDAVRQVVACDAAALVGERPRLIEAYRDLPLLDLVMHVNLLAEAHTTISIWGKLAEASGIRFTCPFTSPSFLAAVNSVPWEVKLREPKYLVRAALRELGVPEPLIARPKQSFGFPTRYWAPPGALFQPVVEIAARAYDATLLRSLQTEDGGRCMVLWSLLNQFLWTELFEEGRSVEDLAGEIVDRHRAAARRG
jgi:asparagine synthetase B (glutamine-hydrolysing)